ncbi:MAG: M56 family metallopeptidase, partial [Planctomycetes bacterium]|nr:M56 family metallopeptidase [Planctomycetota bacterium]
VLIPDRFQDDFSAEERRCIYLHELTHLKRRDSWLLLMAAAYRCLVWFTPASRQALARIQEGIEIACDRAVLKRSGVRQFSYAELILKAQVQGTSLAPGFSAAGVAEVRARIEEIVGAGSRAPRSIRERVCLALFAAFLFGAAAYGYTLHSEYDRKWCDAVAPFHNGGQIVELDNGLTVRMTYTFMWRGALNSYGSAYSELVKDAVIAVPGGGSVTVVATPSRYSL